MVGGQGAKKIAARNRREGARRTKRSTLAGSWYPGDPAALGDLIDSLLLDAAQSPLPAASGLIVPHAAYEYSGAVAAAAYRALQGQPCDRIVLLAPSHTRAFHGVAVLDSEAFETPLGQVPIDPAIAELELTDLICADPTPFEREHSLEIQLPFVQRVQPRASVVPLLFGELVDEDYGTVATALDLLAGERTVFVVSSDFTHYGWRFGYEPFPAQGAEYVKARLRELDMGAIAPVLRGDAPAFRRYLSETGDTVCGRVPIAAFLSWAGPEQRGELLAYRTSLDVSGDYEHCVSYAAIAFSRR